MRTTFLGPWGTTFSHRAMLKGLKNLETSPVTFCESEYLEANSNSDVLPNLLKDPENVSAVLAVETSKRIVSQSWISMMNLLDKYPRTMYCPIQICGCIVVETKFALMARKGFDIKRCEGILCHEEAQYSCDSKFRHITSNVVNVASNGLAAEFVAQKDVYQNFCAVAPRMAAEKFGLEVLDDSVQDGNTWTRFYYWTSKKKPCGVFGKSSDKENRAMIVFELDNDPNRLVLALFSFGNHRLNLSHIQTHSLGDGKLRFAIEVVVKGNQLDDFFRVLNSFVLKTKKALVFGPFRMIG